MMRHIMMLQVKINRADGTPGIASISSAPVRDAHGTIIAGAAVCEDVTGA